MTIQKMAIIGTGVMGMGIAQIAAQAGVEVRLFDVQTGAAERGLQNLQTTLDKLVVKGKLTAEQTAEVMSCFSIALNIEDVADVDLVVEAIVENMEVKQKLFQQLEAIVSENTILASNTSSLSVTEIASACQHQLRVAGFHFFNPVPLMKIVEVIAGLATDQQTVDALLELAQRMGHFGVKTKDTPGFIVNHAGRAYGTEALKALAEGTASMSEIDRILREGAGFRMGPFELFDLTALDVSHPVMESIFNQYYQEARYRPNVLTRQMLSGKKVGKKVGEGFYKYNNGVKTNEAPPQAVPTVTNFKAVWLKTDLAEDAEILEKYLQEQNISLDQGEQPATDSLILLATYGEDTTTAALRYGIDPTRTINIDMLTDFAKHRTLMPSIVTYKVYIDQAHAMFAADDHGVSVIAESIGFIAQRVLAMVVNLSCDMAQQAIASATDINQAVKLGLGYPHGPIAWGDVLGAQRILLILERMTANTNDPRYRPSSWLQRRARLNLSLLHTSAI